MIEVHIIKELIKPVGIVSSHSTDTTIITDEGKRLRIPNILVWKDDVGKGDMLAYDDDEGYSIWKRIVGPI